MVLVPIPHLHKTHRCGCCNLIDLDASKKLQYVIAMENKLSVLDDKHKIIYMTYKAYYTRGKKLPRSVLEKLRNRLGLTQVTVRVYKREACIALNDLELCSSTRCMRGIRLV